MFARKFGQLLNVSLPVSTRSYSSSSVRMMGVSQPRQTKYKKCFVGGNFGKINNTIDFHDRKYGIVELRSTEASRITVKQIEAIKASMGKILKKFGRLTINIFPYTPISQKPLEVRMGKGKGNVDHYCAKVGLGVSIAQIESSNTALAIKALKSAQFRLPCTTRIISL